MSIKLVAEVFEMPLKPNEKLVLLALADCANDEGFAYPGYKKLLKKTSLARATLAKNLKILEKAGLFQKESHATIGKGKGVNTYQLALRNGPENLKEKLEKAREEVAKSSTAELGENQRKVQPVKSSPDEPRKVQGVNSKSSTVEHEPSILTVSKEPSESSNNYQELENAHEEKKSDALENKNHGEILDNDLPVGNNPSCQQIETPNHCEGVEQKEKTTKEMPRPELPTDKLTREHFWIYRADYDVLKADYSQNDIDLYIQKYNNQVTKSGKAYPSPVGTIREWMLSDKIPKKKVYDPEWDKIMFQANFPRFEWETDEGYEERMKRFVKAGLHHHHDGNIRKWLNDDAVEIARQITSEVRGEYGYQ